jgi:SPP1 family predicted phage head-tail adaptor
VIEPGEFNRPLNLERRTLTVDANGENVETWSVITRLWANVRPLSGREFFEAAQLKSDITHRVRIRYYGNITTKDRLDLDGRKMNIAAPIIREGEGREAMTLMCVEVTT